MMMLRLVAIALSLALLLSACGGPAGSAPSPAPPAGPTATEPAANPLAGTAWVLVSIDGAEVPPDPVIRLAFSDHEASGFAGCNFFGGQYRADGATLRLSDVVQSAMLCEDSPLMQQEAGFLDALRATDTYAIAGETLELRDGSGAARLVLRSQGREAGDPSRLHGTRWQLASIGGQAPVGDRPITLELTADGLAVGDAGCRTYAATWQAEADRIGFPSIQMAGEDCASPVLLAQEGAFTDALSTAHTYRIADGQLELLSDRSGPLRFAPLP